MKIAEAGVKSDSLTILVSVRDENSEDPVQLASSEAN